MTRNMLFRRIVGVVAVTLAIGAIGGPASARTFDFNSHGSLVQQTARSSSPVATNPVSAGTGIEWGYVAVGASAVALALVAVGAVVSGQRRVPQRTGNHLA